MTDGRPAPDRDVCDGLGCSGFRDSESLAVLTAKDHYLRVIIHLVADRCIVQSPSIIKERLEK
jgi:hypothetical protein